MPCILPEGVQRTVLFSNPPESHLLLRVERDGETGHAVVVVADAVAVLAYVRDRDEVVLVSQRRAPAVRMDNSTGTVTETVAGRLDYEASVQEIAAHELEEEAEVIVSPDRIQVINDGNSLYSSPGVLAEKIYLAFVEVTSADIRPGEHERGVDGEKIRRKFVPASSLRAMTFDAMPTMALVQWFLNERNRKEDPSCS